MTHSHPLEALLEHAADRVPVGPAPTDRLAREAGRARRGRLASLSGAAAVLVVAGGLTGIASHVHRDPVPTPAGPVTTSSPPEPVPEGTRLVGLGSAAIAVPEDWGTNADRCGVPQRDTVVIDVGLIEGCAASRPEGVDSVEVTATTAPFAFEADETLTLAGTTVERQATTCSEDPSGVEVCRGTLRLPSLDVTFRAESSTGAATVDQLLAGVRILDGQRGVPGYELIFNSSQERSGERYAQALRGQGFAVRTVVVDSDLPDGFVEGVSPAPGTVVDAGASVVVEVSGDR